MVTPIVWDKTMELMTPSEAAQIHEATLTVLGKTGIKMPLKPDRLEKAQDLGLKYDKSKDRVYFTADVVEKALKSAPAEYTLYSRNPENDLVIDSKHGYLTSDGSATRIMDIDTGEIRNSVTKDLENLGIVTDYMPQISFLWPSIAASDKTERIQSLYELRALFMNTSKHIQAMTAVDSLNARGTVEIARSVVGGAEALRKKPVISNFQCGISPLTYHDEALEAAFIFAEAGVPTGFMNMQIGCATAPATLAGNLVLGNAEVLAGIVLLELLYPGTPTFYGACSTTMELTQGGINAGCPEDVQLQALNTQMSHFYKVPANIGTFASSAKTIDWETGVRNAASCAASMLAKADMMCGAGLFCCASVFALEQMVLDCENFEFVQRMLRGIKIDEETLALDVIDAVGPGGHYMTQDHTVRHLRDPWQAKIMHRGSYEDWIHKGKKGPAEKANEMVKKILATHKPVIHQDASNVDEIIAEYERYAAEE